MKCVFFPKHIFHSTWEKRVADDFISFMFNFNAYVLDFKKEKNEFKRNYGKLYSKMSNKQTIAFHELWWHLKYVLSPLILQTITKQWHFYMQMWLKRILFHQSEYWRRFPSISLAICMSSKVQWNKTELHVWIVQYCCTYSFKSFNCGQFLQKIIVFGFRLQWMPNKNILISRLRFRFNSWEDWQNWMKWQTLFHINNVNSERIYILYNCVCSTQCIAAYTGAFYSCSLNCWKSQQSLQFVAWPFTFRAQFK